MTQAGFASGEEQAEPARRLRRKRQGPFLSVADVAEQLGVSEVTLYRAINAGEFPAVRIRGRLIVPAKVVQAMADAAMAEQKVVNTSDWVLVQRSDVREGA